MNKLLLGRYINADSWLHRLDPRTKLILAILFVVVVFIANHWLLYLVLFIYLAYAIRLSGIRLSYFLNGLKPLRWLIIFTVIFQLAFNQTGEVVFSWTWITITTGGLTQAAYIFMRLTLIVSMSTLLTLTTSPLELTDGLEYLMRPLKKLGFPSDDVALMLSIALRYVPTLSDEATTIMNAQRSRGVDFDSGNLLERIRSMVPIIVPLFVSAFNRAEEMAIAMEARGYQGSEGRTKYRVLSFKAADALALVSFIAVTAVMITIRRIIQS